MSRVSQDAAQVYSTLEAPELANRAWTGLEVHSVRKQRALDALRSPTGIWALCATGALLVTLLVVAWPSSASEDTIQYQCLYAVGGGQTSGSGGFPQKQRLNSAGCRKAIAEYLRDGQYAADLRDAGAQAMAFYQDTDMWPAPNASQLLIFDIDETCLSNAEYELRIYAGDLKDDNGTSWQEWVESLQAPAIQPTLDVYKAAYNRGFSLAFITGRSESGRKATVENLRRAGFGSQCKKKGADGEPREEEPCWEELHMRAAEDEEKPASVYKPERRARLLKEGYSIEGCFGDQWSDLGGLHPCTASFKLPNPMYYIL